MASNLVSSLLPVAMPFVPSSEHCSVRSEARSPDRSVLAPKSDAPGAKLSRLLARRAHHLFTWRGVVCCLSLRSHLAPADGPIPSDEIRTVSLRQTRVSLVQEME